MKSVILAIALILSLVNIGYASPGGAGGAAAAALNSSRNQQQTVNRYQAPSNEEDDRHIRKVGDIICGSLVGILLLFLGVSYIYGTRNNGTDDNGDKHLSVSSNSV